MKIVYLTAGAAGMYCGSCMLDNALARSLMRLGHDVQLTPLYTPIKTDEEDISLHQVFFGGINVYLQQKFAWARYLPRWLDSILNLPWLIRQLTANTGKTSPALLGALATSMLRGMDGYQRKEVVRLCDWIGQQGKPDAVVLTNLLIGGCIPELRQRLQVPVYVILQGDDIFLDSLHDRDRAVVLASMQRLVPYVSGFIVHSHDYGRRMAQLLEIPEDRWHVVPLGIDVHEFESHHGHGESTRASSMPHKDLERPLQIGYFARMAPEKGLHRLVDAFLELSKHEENRAVSLQLAGWKGPQHEAYWDEQQRKLAAANCDGRWKYWGSLNRHDKLAFFRSIDLLTVPTTYKEPKGLFVLEAAAAGVPYLQPNQGAFPELHARLEMGWLFEANDDTDYVRQLSRAIDQLRQLPAASISSRGPDLKAIRSEIAIDRMAHRFLDVLSKPAPAAQ